jgi:hypothetical protein
MSRFGRTVAVVVSAAALAACAPQSGGGPVGGPAVAGPARSPGPPAVSSQWRSCDEAAPPEKVVPDSGGDAFALPRLDGAGGFVPVAAVICAVVPEKRADGGTDLVAIEERATDIAALVEALRLPDERSTDGVCDLSLVSPPWLALVDAGGRWIRPGVPFDACGKPRIEVREATEALTLTRVSTRGLRQIESAAAAATGCGQGWADMVWVTTQDGSVAPGPIDELRVWADELRVCVFAVPAEQQRSGKPAGDFVRGGPLTPARRDAVERALLAAGPAVPCDTPAGRFALVSRPDHTHGEIYVELDGCRRILVSPVDTEPVLAQGDAALAALLATP